MADNFCHNMRLLIGDYKDKKILYNILEAKYKQLRKDYESLYKNNSIFREKFGFERLLPELNQLVLSQSAGDNGIDVMINKYKILKENIEKIYPALIELKVNLFKIKRENSLFIFIIQSKANITARGEDDFTNQISGKEFIIKDEKIKNKINDSLETIRKQTEEIQQKLTASSKVPQFLPDQFINDLRNNIPEGLKMKGQLPSKVIKVPVKVPVSEPVKVPIKVPVKVSVSEPVKVPVSEPVKVPVKEIGEKHAEEAEEKAKKEALEAERIKQTKVVITPKAIKLKEPPIIITESENIIQDVPPLPPRKISPPQASGPPLPIGGPLSPSGVKETKENEEKVRKEAEERAKEAERKKGEEKAKQSRTIVLQEPLIESPITEEAETIILPPLLPRKSLPPQASGPPSTGGPPPPPTGGPPPPPPPTGSPRPPPSGGPPPPSTGSPRPLPTGGPPPPPIGGPTHPPPTGQTDLLKSIKSGQTGLRKTPTITKPLPSPTELQTNVASIAQVKEQLAEQRFNRVGKDQFCKENPLDQRCTENDQEWDEQTGGSKYYHKYQKYKVKYNSLKS